MKPAVRSMVSGALCSVTVAAIAGYAIDRVAAQARQGATPRPQGSQALALAARAAVRQGISRHPHERSRAGNADAESLD
jgi:hypothetical protein